MRASVTDAPIDLASIAREVAVVTNGATAMFLGTVRDNNDGRSVSGIEYSAYREMAELEMHSILQEAGKQFGIEHAVVVHRIGTLRVGDTSIAVATAHAHRAAAMDSLRYIVEQTKSRAPVWKLELYDDGTREWVGAGGVARQ